MGLQKETTGAGGQPTLQHFRGYWRRPGPLSDSVNEGAPPPSAGPPAPPPYLAGMGPAPATGGGGYGGSLLALAPAPAVRLGPQNLLFIARCIPIIRPKPYRC